MGVFGRSTSDGSGNSEHEQAHDIRSKEERQNFKIRSSSGHDQILEAVQEAQPFEQAADTFQDNRNRQSYLDGAHMVDVFGQQIRQPDVSNPTRSRDERPLDTIRGFEYAISGDPMWAQQLETHQFGFRVRPGFKGYANEGGYPQTQQSANMYQEQSVYQAPTPADGDQQKKKKKRGLFGRKKKN